jgi:hypothetical protein
MTWFTAQVEDGEGRTVLTDQGGWSSIAAGLFMTAVRAADDGRFEATYLGNLAYRMVVGGTSL